MNKKSMTSDQLSEKRRLIDSQMPLVFKNLSTEEPQDKQASPSRKNDENPNPTEETKPKERVRPYGIKPFQRLINSPNIYQ